MLVQNKTADIAKDRCARKGKLSTKSRDELPAKAYGLPKERKYPMYKTGRDGKLIPSGSHATSAKGYAKKALKAKRINRIQYDRIVRKADRVLKSCGGAGRKPASKVKRPGRKKR